MYIYVYIHIYIDIHISFSLPISLHRCSVSLPCFSLSFKKVASRMPVSPEMILFKSGVFFKTDSGYPKDVGVTTAFLSLHKCTYECEERFWGVTIGQSVRD